MGAGSSFSLTFLMVLLTACIGTAIGLIAGFYGGAADGFLARLTDIFLAFPSSVFAIAVAGILGAGVFNTVFALSLVWWTRYARLVRSAAMGLRERDFVWQARFGGAGEVRILFRYVLPEILPQVVTTAALDIGDMMMALAGLSFLGPRRPASGARMGVYALREPDLYADRSLDDDLPGIGAAHNRHRLQSLRGQRPGYARPRRSEIINAKIGAGAKVTKKRATIRSLGSNPF